MSTVIVSGLGRCGTSLVMQMLAAGGIDCYGPFPAYEPEGLGMGRDLPSLLALRKAFKLLDPHRDAALPSLKGTLERLDSFVDGVSWKRLTYARLIAKVPA